MARVERFTPAQLQGIAQVLGNGLVGSEIARILSQCGIEGFQVGPTKWRVLLDTLGERQDQDRCGNNVVAFIQAAMDPVRYAGDEAHFQGLRTGVNEVLAFSGMRLREDGKVVKGEPAATLSEAAGRAGRLRTELQRRGVHPDVLRFCRAELLEENYFHAVLEATKSVADKIREKTGLTADGAKLVDEAFTRQRGLPVLALNSLRTETEQMEHAGLMNLLKGMFGAFRNPTAHAPKIHWAVSEQDALDLLSLASLLHRRLDDAIPTGSSPKLST